MKLRDAKVIFDRLREDPRRVNIRPHAYRAHPERKFTPFELKQLVAGSGRLTDNTTMPTAQADSFMWVCKDVQNRPCEIVVVFETLAPNQMIVVIHAYREV